MPATPQFRPARPEDAEQVALLHTDSWRRHYRGAYADAYLDGDILSDRRTVWSARLAAPAGTVTLLAEDPPGSLLGFVHLVPDEDAVHGSLVDNLHVVHGRHRSGLGRALLTRAAAAAAERAAGPALYLWVLEPNIAAQAFYRSLGGRVAERVAVSPPGGVPGRLAGTPYKLRLVWPDAAALAAQRLT
ncbi:GNAT family N-acetyltransferase [Kitasatospora sp. NPDC048365]|uniref:GNAT family N-acetyltransferase n=1 Tax=Kitasatospora sp. NPDC048365 TaxID=3364050 RepID=UPI00371FE3D6